MIFEIAFSARFKRSLADFFNEVAAASALGAAAFVDVFGAFFADVLGAAFFEVAAGFAAALSDDFTAAAFFATFLVAFLTAFFTVAFVAEVFADFAGALTAFFAIESSWKRLKYLSRNTKIVSYFGFDYQNSLCHANSHLGSAIERVFKMRQKSDFSEVASIQKQIQFASAKVAE